MFNLNYKKTEEETVFTLEYSVKKSNRSSVKKDFFSNAKEFIFKLIGLISLLKYLFWVIESILK